MEAAGGIARGLRRLAMEAHRSATWQYALAAFIGTALFPRAAYRLRWPCRLQGWTLVAYIAFNTLLGFAFRQVVFPRIRSSVATIDGLRTELGREPTHDELAEALGLGPPHGRGS